MLNPRNGHRVGTVTQEAGAQVFTRRVTESRHKLRMLGGAWALETPLLAKLEAFGVQWERIVTADTGRVLCVPLSLYRERGTTINYPGFGVQLALPESCFSDSIVGVFEDDGDKPGGSSMARSPNPPRMTPPQGSLFAEGLL